MVSTLANGQMRPYVGASDIVIIHSVADIAGLNQLTRTVLAAGAADALVGMVLGRVERQPEPGRPPVTAAMFGLRRSA